MVGSVWERVKLGLPNGLPEARSRLPCSYLRRHGSKALASSTTCAKRRFAACAYGLSSAVSHDADVVVGERRDRDNRRHGGIVDSALDRVNRHAGGMVRNPARPVSAGSRAGVL